MKRMEDQKPDYGNWVPAAMMKILAALTVVLLIAELLFLFFLENVILSVIVGILLTATVLFSIYMWRCRVIFDFRRGGLMGEIHQYLVDHLDRDGTGTLLDIGCGAGALTIRCARRFPDESFDAAVSNFVFHEVRAQPDKRQVVRKALRVVKQGGSFAFQDLFSQKKLYGNMEEFVEELRQEGIGEIHYIPFVERQGFIPGFVQAPWMLHGIGLIYGKKIPCSQHDL